MITLNQIKTPVAKELKNFESFFRKATKSDIRILNIIVNYVIRTRGKQIRPLFVFLAAKMHGEINHNTYLAATTIELLHSASLIHDDVVDDSYERRGYFSINALWKNKISVLLGDFLLAKGLLIATEGKAYEILDISSKAVKEMIEGELLQYEKSRKLDIDEETYIEIIRKKTASLFATSIAVGVNSVNPDPDLISRMYEIGILAGLAFQIRDDIFDYQRKDKIGKPTGNDIKEKKITLPLIHVLNNSTPGEKRKILNIVKRKNLRKDKVQELINLVNEKNGIEYSIKKMNQFCNEALEKLSAFPQNEASLAMAQLIQYIIERKK
ncbi:MAG: polyprenyl synthetase family protein [Prolixibacteraceae bacterium]|nr:polyprenyl synthetase family protein [Prolixibacteraceae bacterium]